MKHLKREVDDKGYKIIKGVGKKIYGWKASEVGISRKQTPVCSKHHDILHSKGQIGLGD